MGKLALHGGVAAFSALALLSGTASAQGNRHLIPSGPALWSARGVGLDVGIINDWYDLKRGGVERGTVSLVNLDLVLTVDTDEALMWEDGRFLVYVLGTDGGDPSLRTGDLQMASNIETFDALNLFEAWYEHEFPAWQSSLLVGLHDLNRDFYSLDYSGLFLNSSFGVGPDLSQNSTSLYPTASFGLRYRYQPLDGRYAHVAVYDGVPGEPGNPHGAHIQFNDGDGYFSIAEVGVVPDWDRHTKLGIGTWYHSAVSEGFLGEEFDDNQGLYLLGERELWRSGGNRSLGGFLQLGFAQDDRNQVAQYVGTGLSLAGFLKSRPDDVVGLAVAHARNGHTFMAFNQDMVRAETVVEFSYLFSPLPWLTLQPDVQYILDPGASATTEDAVVATMRVELSF